MVIDALAVCRLHFAYYTDSLSAHGLYFVWLQGYRCSRCMYTQHCSGCELSREREINLQPADHLAVKFTDLSVDELGLASRYTDHKSMEKLLPTSPLTLFDCFKAFTERSAVLRYSRCFVWRASFQVIEIVIFFFHSFSLAERD
jgi:hypothetical protein